MGPYGGGASKSFPQTPPPNQPDGCCSHCLRQSSGLGLATRWHGGDVRNQQHGSTHARPLWVLPMFPQLAPAITPILLLDDHDKLTFWGGGHDGLTNVPSGLSNVLAFSIGNRQALAISADSAPSVFLSRSSLTRVQILVITLTGTDDDNDPLSFLARGPAGPQVPFIDTSDGVRGPAISQQYRRYRYRRTRHLCCPFCTIWHECDRLFVFRQRWALSFLPNQCGHRGPRLTFVIDPVSLHSSRHQRHAECNGDVPNPLPASPGLNGVLLTIPIALLPSMWLPITNPSACRQMPARSPLTSATIAASLPATPSGSCMGPIEYSASGNRFWRLVWAMRLVHLRFIPLRMLLPLPRAIIISSHSGWMVDSFRLGLLWASGCAGRLVQCRCHCRWLRA